MPRSFVCRIIMRWSTPVWVTSNRICALTLRRIWNLNHKSRLMGRSSCLAILGWIIWSVLIIWMWLFMLCPMSKESETIVFNSAMKPSINSISLPVHSWLHSNLSNLLKRYGIHAISKVMSHLRFLRRLCKIAPTKGSKWANSPILFSFWPGSCKLFNRANYKAPRNPYKTASAVKSEFTQKQVMKKPHLKILILCTWV